jgi:hypothetical protein
MAQTRARDRAAQLARIVKVQEQLHRAEERRLAEIQDEFDRLRRDETDLIALLNSEDGLAGLFMDATVNRLRSVAEQQIQVALQRQAQTQAVLDTGSRLKAAEKLHEEAERDARREAEQEQLAEATERLSWQAPGKIVGG